MTTELTISKANSFVEASYAMTLDEMRVLSLTLGVFDPFAPKRNFEFTVADFCEHFPDVNPVRAYEQVERAIKKLSTRWMTLEDNDRYKKEVAFVTDRTYFKKEGRFEIVIHEKLMPYVANLKRRYTTYQLVNIGAFTSTHTIRLYELLTQYKKIGEREIGLTQLKDWLQVPEKYSLYANFRRRVLEPAIQEINEKSDLSVQFEPINRGKKIVGLMFSITRKRCVELRKDITKHGRPILPKRPQVKAGSHEEGVYFRECLKIIRTYWLEQYPGAEWRTIWNELPTSELELLEKFYRGCGDTHNSKPIKRIIESRPTHKENKNE